MAPLRGEVENRQPLSHLDWEFLPHPWPGPPPASAESPRPVPCLRLVLRVPDPPELPPEFSPLEPSKSWRPCLQVTEPMRQTALMPTRGIHHLRPTDDPGQSFTHDQFHSFHPPLPSP